MYKNFNQKFYDNKLMLMCAALVQLGYALTDIDGDMEFANDDDKFAEFINLSFIFVKDNSTVTLYDNNRYEVCDLVNGEALTNILDTIPKTEINIL